MDILPVFSVVPSHSAGLNRRGTQFLSGRSDNASVAACSANSRRLFQRQDLTGYCGIHCVFVVVTLKRVENTCVLDFDWFRNQIAVL